MIKSKDIDFICKKITKLTKLLPKNKQSSIKLLTNKQVILWSYGITDFLTPENKIIGYKYKNTKIQLNSIYKSGEKQGECKFKLIKECDLNKPIYKYNKTTFCKISKDNESQWNMSLMKQLRPDLFNKRHSQSSLFGLFGEQLVKEYYILTNEFKTDKPKIKNYILDLETNKNIIEVKTSSFFTTGTAKEKIYGVPWKYSNVSLECKKPLLVILLGCNKGLCDLVEQSNCKNKESIKQFWKDNLNVEFIKFTDLLNNL